jgi:hypothetical protein
MATGNKARESHGIFTLLPLEAVELDAGAFDHLVRTKGVKFVHHRAIPCPVGLTDEHDLHRTHADHSGCSNGFIYKPIGRVTSVFTSNSTDPRKLEEGYYDGSTVVVTFPRFYDEPADKRVMVRPLDRLYLEEEDLLVAIWDKTHRRNDGMPDRVEFPIKHVEHLVDSNGAWHEEGIDFEVVDGCIVWLAGKGPAPGTVYTAWYTYRPYWYVDRLVHEIRVTPVPDYMDASLVAMERLAYGAVLHREYVYRNQQNDDQSPSNKGRQQRAPDSPEPQEF